jgi:LPXTG-motif cell wall-anchored protein
VPKSKTRKKKKGQPGYVPPEKRKKPPPSPRWYPFLFLGLMAAGVLIIVLNYMALIPGTDQTQPVFLWVGLGLIASGFLVATKYR